MSEMIVISFKEESGAENHLPIFQKLQEERFITLTDAAVVIRKNDGKVEIKQATRLVGAGTLGGPFWGMFVGLLLWMPWIGMATGEVSRTVYGRLSEIGLDDDFVKDVVASLDFGTSALFLVVADWNEANVIILLQTDAEIIRTKLKSEGEKNLRSVLLNK